MRVAAVTASLFLALFSATAYAGENPNVPGSSPYAIGAYDVNATGGLGSGFRDAAAPGVVAGVGPTPLTVIPTVVNSVIRRAS